MRCSPALRARAAPRVAASRSRGVSRCALIAHDDRQAPVSRRSRARHCECRVRDRLCLWSGRCSRACLPRTSAACSQSPGGERSARGFPPRRSGRVAAPHRRPLRRAHHDTARRDGLLDVIGPGEAFGELALLSPGSRRSATVESLDDGETLSVYRDDFALLQSEHPGVKDVLCGCSPEQLPGRATASSRRTTPMPRPASAAGCDLVVRQAAGRLHDAGAPGRNGGRRGDEPWSCARRSGAARWRSAALHDRGGSRGARAAAAG